MRGKKSEHETEKRSDVVDTSFKQIELREEEQKVLNLRQSLFTILLFLTCTLTLQTILNNKSIKK